MKVLLLNINRIYKSLVLSIIFTLMISSGVQAERKLLSRKEALIIAESTKEAEALYMLFEGRLKNCIDKEVVKPCESEWVTCIDNAWVVQFTVSDVCKIEHDGRLGLTVLIDSSTGKILSRYPEFEYFKKEDYCLEHYECACVSSEKDVVSCKNFIFYPIIGQKNDACGCQCINNVCNVKKNKS